MAAIFNTNTKTEQHVPAAPACENTHSFKDLTDAGIIKQTVWFSLAERQVKLGPVPYAFVLALECKAAAFDAAKDKAKIIDAITDEQLLKFQLLDATGATVSERVVRVGELKVLQSAWLINELAIRSADRMVGSLATAHFEAEEEAGAIKLNFITGDKHYGARTIVAIPKIVTAPVTLVEIVNALRITPNMDESIN